MRFKMIINELSYPLPIITKLLLNCIYSHKNIYTQKLGLASGPYNQNVQLTALVFSLKEITAPIPVKATILFGTMLAWFLNGCNN